LANAGSCIVNAVNGNLTVAGISATCKAIADAGGEPNAILVSPAQRVVLSTFNDSYFSVQKRAEYNSFSNFFIDPISGNLLEIFVDNSVPQNGAFVLDTTSVKTHWLRPLFVTPDQSGTFDGDIISVIGELTASYSAADSTIAYLSGLTV